MGFYTYIVANRRNGTLYIGSTDDIARRTYEHREKVFKGFTARYGLSRLVWYEVHDSREAAFQRERQIKAWNLAWKLELIEGRIPSGTIFI